MSTYTLEAIVNFIQIIVLAFTLISCFRLFKKVNASMTAVFFFFAVFSCLIIDIYWVAYDLMKAGTRMPFAANEFGEAAMFLLYSAVITTVFRERLIREKAVLAISILFIAASTGLWMAWSGEWLQDIITGLSFGYLFCVTVMALRTTDAFDRKEWSVLTICAVLLILCQFAIFIVPDALRKPLDILCYALMLTLLSLLFAKCIQSIRLREKGKTIIALTFGCFVWTSSTMYMSSGIWYVIALLAETLITPLMLAGVRKEVQSE